MNNGEFELLGELLIKSARVTRQRVDEALAMQKRVRKRIGEILLDMKAVTEDDLINTLSEQSGVAVAPREALLTADVALGKLLPEPFAREYGVLPLKRDGNAVVTAFADPENPSVTDQARKLLGAEIKPLLAGKSAINEGLNRIYDSLRKSGEVAGVLSGLEFELKDESEGGTDLDMDALRKEVDDAPIVRLVNLLLHEALKERATDIHIEPGSAEMVVRYRIDGALQDFMRVPQKSHHGVVSRIKILAKLNIAESRIPQDGRITLRLPDREVDVRVSILPTGLGEKIVLRILDKVAFDFRLSKLGFEPDDMLLFEKCIHKPYGIVLISGPTGSGKSTTLYSALREVKSSEDNIVTVEDPVEYQMEGITQVAVNDKVGLSFGNTLRSVLRQDPDKILIGEIRDQETADIAMKFALTGHLVFSTLHANDAASTITRLIDIGVPPFLVGSSLVLVMAQRLIRRICPDCKEVSSMTEKELLLLDLSESDRKKPVYKGNGCARCRQTGYYGRVGIFEIMPVAGPLRQLIFDNANQDAIRAAAIKAGMKTLRGSALEKLFGGVTTVHEVLKTTISE